MTARAWVWAAGSAACFVAAQIAVALVIVLPIQYFALLPHPASVAVWAATWVVLSGLGVLAIGRLVTGRVFDVSFAAWLVLGGGAALDAVLMLTLIDWAARQYGYWDPDQVGATGLLWHAVAATTVAGFAAIIAPRVFVVPAVLLASGGALLTVLIVAPNLPGLLDGVPPRSWAFAATMATVVGYAVGLAAVSVRRLRATD